ncbi:Acyl-CoA Delta(11) desaturase [Frankliniella fusca]|uniref:Acyl-CoA Delta(11) desaturase n=1 Tax=Frankliniella fusca TaxID=407009 RepID=A0AAE1HBC6_9NEOP|nr:Acyl-CoA Delta(11) desaturase [Frankliniella fusca]
MVPETQDTYIKVVPTFDGKYGKKFFKTDIVWFNAIGFLLLHLFAVYGSYLFFLFRIKWQTWLFSVFIGMCSSQGILAGAHRYYAHRSYKANLPLRILIVLFHTVATQNCMWVWVRDHRQHHKYSDTDADPHNASRGFFFSHIGWLMMKKHPDVIEKGKNIDMSDLDNDPLIMFQKKYYFPLFLLFSLAIPTFIPVYYWGETTLNAFMVPFLLRTVLVLNFTWMVNSWAHAFGTKPYDKNIRPVETMVVSIVAFGEGWHNYHHTFPWDYKASEFGVRYNPTTTFINFLARIGWAYDLKQASAPVVKARALRSGDGTHSEVHGTPEKDSATTDSDKLIDICSR